MPEPAAAPVPQRYVKVPKQLGGYRLVTKLGQGGMATVFRAHQVSMDRPVALKVLAPAQAQDANLRTRFFREARLAGRVRHPNVITCFEVGEEHGYLYMALELAEHGDVLALFRRHVGSLPERLALVLMRDCARGLDAIHQAGLLHRDIKPANIFLAGPATAKLADLGVAKDVRRITATDATTSRSVIGTPAYMPPEQAMHAVPDWRSDIYSLGAAFFHLLTGRLPFQGASAHETLAMLRTRTVQDPGEVNPRLSSAALAILRRAMARDPDERHTTALQLLGDIEAALNPARETLAWSPEARAVPSYADGTAPALVPLAP